MSESSETGETGWKSVTAESSVNRRLTVNDQHLERDCPSRLSRATPP